MIDPLAEAAKKAGYSPPGAASGRAVARSRSATVPSLRALAAFLALAAAWQVASIFSRPYLVPGLGLILEHVIQILTTWDLLYQGLITWARLVGAVAIALLIGIPLGLAMGLSRSCDEFVRPIIKFIMGIPALNWVIIVVIWFANTELRIVFVLVMLCVPITVFCVYDGVRSIDRNLVDMVLSFGAGRMQYIRLLLWPYVKAFAFTAAKLNIGNSVRTVIVAELVGAPLGIGRELDLAKNLFDMAAVLAWTLILVGIGLLMTQAIEQVERLTLHWRSDVHHSE